MAASTPDKLVAFQWTPQPEAAALIGRMVSAWCELCPAADALARRLRAETGTRLVDWIDHLMWPASAELESQLAETGFVPGYQGHTATWSHPLGIFPRIRLRAGVQPGAALRVESVSDFLVAQRQSSEVAIDGQPLSPLRRACVADHQGSELWVFERNGSAGYNPIEVDDQRAAAAQRHLDAFRNRPRAFADSAEGFSQAAGLARAAIEELGVDWTCALFFTAEREYWQGRNRAAQRQKARQDQLGLGWGNHDHHTYRSSREHFARLVSLLELLGLECRERFYAGSEAGWGAQVLEQPHAGIVVFADVDLAADEVADDFAHQSLDPQRQLGTVGLWCRLHGEAMLEAGMHHLEAQFAFDLAREQLRDAGVETMAPFTDFPYLKQCFTRGELWPVPAERVDALLQDARLTPEQADQFRQQGAIGSHLEILERNDGYKGFNQTGVSEIIRATDPRQQKL